MYHSGKKIVPEFKIIKKDKFKYVFIFTIAKYEGYLKVCLFPLKH
jgi:hypothetical protein